MSSKKILFFIFILISILANSQDNIIDVNGYSYKSILPKEISLKITISDVAPNEYKKTRYKKLEQVYSEFTEKLAQNGVTSKLIEDDKYYPENSYNGNSVNFEHYSLTLKNEKEVNALKKFFIEGVQIKNIYYIYDKISEKVIQNLIDEALENAKQNAAYLAKKINRKLGQIISISSSQHEYNTEKELRENRILLTHRVTIKFQLL